LSFGGSIPLSLHRWGEIWHGVGDRSSVPNFTPIGATLPFHCIWNKNYYHW